MNTITSKYRGNHSDMETKKCNKKPTNGFVQHRKSTKTTKVFAQF